MMHTNSRINVGAAALATALVLAVAAACSEVADHRSTLGPEIAFSHKPGHAGGPGGSGGGGDADALVDVTLDSGFAISDDGSGTYVSGQCGAHGKIWEGGSEDVTMTPGKDWKANLGCAKRFFVVDLTDGEDENGNPVSLGSSGTLTHMAIIDLNEVATAEGVWVRVPAQFLGQECDRLRYDSGTLPGSHVNPRAPWTSQDVWAMKVVHSADPAKRAWRVQTLNPNSGVQEDVAACINPERGNKNRLDGFFHVSFSVLIEEQ